MTLASKSTGARTTLRARYVFPIAGPPLADGTVCVENGRIVEVGCGRQTHGEVQDLGNVAIVPGLVNAHVHLNFSHLNARLGQPGISLVDWIRQVMQWRNESPADNASLTQAISTGLEESLRAGVTALGDIGPPDWPLDAVEAGPLEVRLFQELIAPTEERIGPALELARRFLRATSQRPAPSRLHAGVSPHAPYSIHQRLMPRLVELACEQQMPLAMHLAESLEELQLLQSGTGPFRKFLDDLGAWDATAIAPGSRPMDYLRQLAAAPKSLVIHGNYLAQDEVDFVAKHVDRMAVAYCPRTHAWFDHRPYPLHAMLAAGVRVAFGTDGRGSSPDLSLWEEMRFAAKCHPDVERSELLRMATLGGAQALGLERECGSLEPGKWANLAIVPLPDNEGGPFDLLFESHVTPIATYVRGAKVSAGDGTAG